jgi:hypothetical protein
MRFQRNESIIRYSVIIEKVDAACIVY